MEYGAISKISDMESMYSIVGDFTGVWENYLGHRLEMGGFFYTYM